MESLDSSDREEERIVHVREALMSPSDGGAHTLRTGRFLNYTINAIDDDVFELPLDAFASLPEKRPIKLSFSGWGSPSVNWIEWVNTMAESHADTWRKSGVHDAIMASRCHIKKQDDLMIALVEKWCIETNSFVFPWGEATVTLEDMIVLGGFSVIGNNVLGSIKREEMRSVEEKLKKTKREIMAVNSGKKCGVSLWMKEMMNSGSEIEHEAFMVTWLSRYVFPDSSDQVRDKLFAAAVQLARGVRLALAPPVLAGIYRDLGVLKEKLSGYTEEEDDETAVAAVTSPFQFLQVWSWERIATVQPSQPNVLKPGEPRIMQWHNHGGQDSYPKLGNFKTVLDMAKESFEYRPYTKPLKNFKPPKFYTDSNCYVSVDSDEDIVAFCRCLRFSKLVGLDCIEPYYPHRVAKQFGYDIDIPGVVPARIETPELAWKDYIRPISERTLCIPSRHHQADVTFGYIRWWAQSVAALQSAAKRVPAKSPPSPAKEKRMKKVGSFSKSPARAQIDGKDLIRGALRGPRESKDHGRSHVTFVLPNSPGNLPKTRPVSPKPNSKDPPLRQAKASPRVAEKKKQTNLPCRDLRKSGKNDKAVASREITARKSQTAKGSNASVSSYASSSLVRTKKKATKALPDIKQNTRQSNSAKHSSAKEIKLGSENNALKLLDQMVKLKEQIGEGGEVTYQIPKSQLEVFSHGFHEVLMELQTIKSALHIQNDN